MSTTSPFAPGTISVGLYSTSTDAATTLESIFGQARAARDAGFDGVTISEHHAGFPSYVPNPIQVCGWILDRVDDVWAGACPVVLPLRPEALVAEEVAWLHVLHPGRVALGVAPGYAASDFDALGMDHESRATRFRDRLTRLAELLGGGGADPLRQDPAIANLRGSPVPIVAAAGSRAAAQRAAISGTGIITDSLASVDRVRDRFVAHREAGGNGPRVVNRRAWIGSVPNDLVARQLATWDKAGVADGKPITSDVISGDTTEVADRLVEVIEYTGADHLGLKVFLEGLSEREVCSQLSAFGPALERVRLSLERRSRPQP